MAKRQNPPPKPPKIALGTYGGATRQTVQTTAQPKISLGGYAKNPKASVAAAGGSYIDAEPETKHRASWNIPAQALDTATGVFSGLWHMGGAAIKEGDADVRAVLGSMANLPHPSEWFSTEKDPILRSWAHPGSAENKAKYGLSAGQITSARETGAGLVDLASIPVGEQSWGRSAYGKAWKEGQIVNKVVGDVANASIFLGPLGKLVGGAGAALDIARAAKIAEAADVANATRFAEAATAGEAAASSAASASVRVPLPKMYGPLSQEGARTGIRGTALPVSEGADFTGQTAAAANAAAIPPIPEGMITRAGNLISSAGRLGAHGAAAPARVWTAGPGWIAKGIRAAGRVTGVEAAANLPRFTEAVIGAGERVAQMDPLNMGAPLGEHFPRLTAKGREVAEMVRHGRGEAGDIHRDARIAYQEAEAASLPTRAEARAALEAAGEKPTRRAIRQTRREQSIIAQHAASMLREGTAIPLSYLPDEGLWETDLAKLATGVEAGATPEAISGTYGSPYASAEMARSFLRGDLSPETVARVEATIEPMSKLAQAREAAGVERGTINPQQLGYDYLNPPGPEGQMMQQGFADQLHKAYQEHVAVTGAENVTLAELYPAMRAKFGDAYTREAFANDVHYLAESDVVGSSTGAEMTLTGSTGHTTAGPVEGGAPRTTVTAEPTAWTRPSYYGIKFGEETNIPKRLRPWEAAADRTRANLLERASDETLDPVERQYLTELAEEVPSTLDEMAAHMSERAEYGYSGDIEHLIGAGERATTKPGTGGGPFARKVRKFGEQTQAETTLTQRGAREQALLTADRGTEFVKDKVATNIGDKFGKDPEVIIGPTAKTLKPAKLAAEMESRGYVSLSIGAGKNVWVEPLVKAAFDAHWKQGGPRFGFQALSKLNRGWKMGVLPLSPRWHIGNVVGNMIMATVGGGVDPFTLAKELYRYTQNADPRAYPGRLTTSSLAEGERRAMFAAGTEAEGGMLRQTVAKSYQFNSTVDEMFRSAVYAAKKGAGYSDEEAVRIALKAMGDFDKMSPFERNYMREVLPFYSWARHVTQLTLRLPVENPMRVAWMLKLADQYGDDQTVLPKFLQGGLQLADRFLPGSSLNPLADIDRSPFSSALNFGSAMSPFLKVPFQQLTGIDPSHEWNLTTRSESMGGRNARGTLTTGPLPANALPNLIVNQLPLARLARDIIPIPGVQSWGQPGARLNSGEPYMQGGERVGAYSRPEAIARTLLPWPRKVTQEEIDSMIARETFNRG